MQSTPAWETLKQFRLAADQTLGLRQDSLVELLEAAVTGAGPAPIVRLSLGPVFRRGWSSAPDALAEGEVDADGCRRLVQGSLSEPPPGGRPVWALAGPVWPRPAAATSPARTSGHRTLPGVPRAGVVPAWAYAWRVAVPAPGPGWVLPREVRRRGPSDGTPTAVAVSLLRAARTAQPAARPRPVGTLDRGYAPVPLARAELPLDGLVRLRSTRGC